MQDDHRKDGRVALGELAPGQDGLVLGGLVLAQDELAPGRDEKLQVEDEE